MATLSITSLLSFFSGEKKSIKRGENHFKSDHVEAFTYHQGVLRGEVRASMKKKVYKVTIDLDEKFEIKSTECECPRGQFKCSHAAALFIHGIHNVSRTDVECKWRKRKSNASLSTQAIREMFPTPKKYAALSRKPTQADRSTLYGALKEYGMFTGLCWLLSPEPPVAKKPPIPAIEDIIFSDEFLQAIGRQQQLDCFVRRYRIQEAEIARISELTVGQRVKAFTHKTDKTVKETGIWLHCSGILGASPDGIVDDDTVLEAKCPYTERNLTTEEAVKSTAFCLEKSEDGKGNALKKNHVYWHQIQGEMYFSQRKYCYFVVWTTKDVTILKIERDESWAANIPVLTEFYFNHIFQKVVEGEL